MPPNPLTDCPAQHGGAERQQLTDVAACPRRSARGVTLDWLRAFTDVRERARFDHEFDRSQTDCADETSRPTTAEVQTIRERTDKRFACEPGLQFSALTFDMSGSHKWAKPACDCPFDGRVRARCMEALCADNKAREAASFGIVQMKVLDSGITEKTLDLRNDSLSLAYSGVHDHMPRIVRSKGDEALADVLRYFIRFQDSLLCAPAHKDGTRCLVRGVSSLMHVGQQEQFFADVCVNETDPTGIARFLCGYHSLGVKASKLCVR